MGKLGKATDAFSFSVSWLTCEVSEEATMKVDQMSSMLFDDGKIMFSSDDVIR